MRPQPPSHQPIESSYPLPSYAATIWTNGEALFMVFPPSAGHSRSSLVQLPLDETAFHHFVSILQTRRAEDRASRIAEPGTPVNAEVLRGYAEALKRNKAQRDAAMTERLRNTKINSLAKSDPTEFLKRIKPTGGWTIPPQPPARKQGAKR